MLVSGKLELFKVLCCVALFSASAERESSDDCTALNIFVGVAAIYSRGASTFWLTPHETESSDIDNSDIYSSSEAQCLIICVFVYRLILQQQGRRSRSRNAEFSAVLIIDRIDWVYHRTIVHSLLCQMT